jgi:uncharacterized protein YndB with AHSA1/START domain
MTGRTVVDAQDYGQLERRGGRLVLRFTRRLPHPPQRVWRALTEPGHLAAWFPTTIEGERAAGARLRFAFTGNEAAPFDGEMLAFDPPSLLEMRWGDEILRFELRPAGEGSVLTFTDTFDEIGKAARDAAGWHSCLDLLGYAAGGQQAPWSPADRWRQVHATYTALLGPLASTIGPTKESEQS